MTRVVLRFDDLCPTMKWSVWDAIEKVLDRHGVHPIVAIVPDSTGVLEMKLPLLSVVQIEN